MDNNLYKQYVELQVLEALAKNRTQKSIADELAIALGKVNYIAKALIQKGYIKAGNFVNAEDKTKYKYLLTDEGLQQKIAITKKFIKIKKAEYEKMQEELDRYESTVK
ncbi:MarR family EPS-associated transcriptional regulator [Arcobacter sp. 15-2]|uniref:MarR family EPS-associated transcriptional regulator n=1 Tax=Arcobacter sp. 15-2 TaxID=3374109 RepID=UPI00399CF5B6